MVAALTPLRASANAVAPTSGQNYVITNVGTGHVLDDFDSSLADGNPILATDAGDNRSNQIVCLFVSFAANRVLTERMSDSGLS